VIKHDDFSTWPPHIVDELRGCKGVVWALGLPRRGNSAADFARVHKTYALAALEAFGKLGEDVAFTYVSGSPVRWSRTWTADARVMVGATNYAC
jgi:hypothetical protein